MSKQFEPPSWSTPPTEEFYFEVLKDGSIVSTLPLSEKPHYTIGRNGDMCDIVLEHQTVSRMHAATMFRGENELMLVDLGSAHGTRVNKKPIAANEYVRLMVGDVVGFGASTRLYIVNGPSTFQQPEYDSANMQLYRQKLADKSARVAKAKEEEDFGGIDWGFREDAVNDDEEEEEEGKANLPAYIKNDENYNRKYGKKYSSSLEESAVHEKDKELLEKIRTKERKIQNMQEEIRRIYMKENSQESGLTEGQVAAVTRNDGRIETLVAEIEELTHKITSKNLQRAAKTEGGSSRDSRDKSGGGDDDDDMYDTTSSTADASKNWRLKKKLAKKTSAGTRSQAAMPAVAVTYESLMKQKDEQCVALAEIRQQLEYEKTKLDASACGESGAGDDALDGYLRNSLAGEVQEMVKKLEGQDAEHSRKLYDIEKLLKIATPAIASLVPKGIPSLASTVPSQDPPKEEQVAVKPPAAEKATTVTPKIISQQRVLETKTPPVARDPVPMFDSTENNIDASAESIVPAPKRKLEDTESTTDSRSPTDAAEIVPPPPKKKIMTASRGPLKAQENEYQFDDSVLEGGEKAWVPPPDQTGDGRSSLNEKFGY